MEELVEFVNDIVDDEETIFVDMPAHPQYSGIIDDEVVDIIRRQTGHNDPSSFQQLDRETQNNLLVSLKKQGASIKQLQRITGIGRNIIQRAKWVGEPSPNSLSLVFSNKPTATIQLVLLRKAPIKKTKENNDN